MATISNRLFRESSTETKWATVTALSKYISGLGNKRTAEILDEAKVPKHVIMVDGSRETEYVLELAKNAIWEWRRKLNEGQRNRRRKQC